MSDKEMRALCGMILAAAVCAVVQETDASFKAVSPDATASPNLAGDGN